MSDDSDEFSVFRDKRGAGRGSIEDPSVRVTPNKILFGKIIHRRILDEAECVEFLIAENGRVGIRPVEGDDADQHHVYSARGGDISCRSVWREVGVEIEERQDLPLDTESQPFPVLDVSGFIGERGEHPGQCEACGRVFDSERAKNIHKGRTHGGEDNDDPDDGEGFECGECEKTFDSETGRNIHAGRVHDGDGGSAGGDDTDGRDHHDGQDDHDEGPILDHERVASAMDSIGIDEDIPTGEVVATIDDHGGTFGVSKRLGITRTDAADLVRRLDLGDALDSSDGLARSRFEAQEGAS